MKIMFVKAEPIASEEEYEQTFVPFTEALAAAAPDVNFIVQADQADGGDHEAVARTGPDQDFEVWVVTEREVRSMLLGEPLARQSIKAEEA